MKYIIYFFVLLFAIDASAQTLTVTPSTVSKGQNLSILFSGSGFSFAQGSNTTGVYFTQGSNTIFPNSTFAYNANTLTGDFDIPSYVDCGSYTAVVFGQGSSTLSFPNALTIDCSTNVSGFVYNDLNNNGINDGEPGMPYLAVTIQPGNIIGYTDQYGYYSMSLAAGNYQVSVSPPTYYTQSSIPAIQTANTALNPTLSGLDFGLHANPVNDVSVTISGPNPRVGFSRTYWIEFCNHGTTVQNPGVTLTLDSNISVSNSQFPYSMINNHTYTFNVPNLNIAPNSCSGFYVDLLTNTNVALGQLASIEAMVNNALQPEANLQDNRYTFTSPFVNSFDPNDKTVQPVGKGPQLETLRSSTLVYTINFQNTGNDVAYLVQIKDTLDASLDWSTLKLLGSSHDVTFSMSNNGVVTFKFLNINLPDSSVDQRLSCGFVCYSIKPKSTNAEGTVITNTAHIYFDFNPAIVTNTTSSKMVTFYTGINDLVADGAFRVFPNPVNDRVQILADKTTIQTIALYDLRGSLIKEVVINDTKAQISTIDLTEGLYLIKINTTIGSAMRRITITH